MSGLDLIIISKYNELMAYFNTIEGMFTFMKLLVLVGFPMTKLDVIINLIKKIKP